MTDKQDGELDAKPKDKPEVKTEVKTEEQDDKKSEKSDKESTDIDYKALFEAEKARNEETKRKAKEAWEIRNKSRKIDTEQIEEEKPLTKSELKALLSEERQFTSKALARKEAEDIASILTASDDERKLVLEIHQNRIFPDGMPLKEQIEEALVIANKNKLIGERNEALRALKNRRMTNNDASTTQQDSLQNVDEPKISSADKSAIIAAGFSWNATSRRYEKKLANGKVLIRDPKSKQTFLAK